MDCCCCGGGGANGHTIVKEESTEDVQQHIFPICKDICFPHLAKTKACEALAKYPASMHCTPGIVLYAACMMIISFDCKTNNDMSN